MEEVVSKEKFYNEVVRIHNIFGYINTLIFKENTKFEINDTYYFHKYHGIKKICEELNLKYIYAGRVPKSDVIILANKIYLKYGKINKVICVENGLHSSLVRRIFGGYNNMFKELGFKINMVKNPKREEIIEDFNKFYKKYKTLSSTDYRKNGKYSQSTIESLFGSWSDFISYLGYSPLNKKIGYDKIIKDVKAIFNKYGFISKDLISDECDFSYQAFSSYFKDKKEMEEVLGGNIFNYGRSSKEKLIKIILEYYFDSRDIYTEHTWHWLKNTTKKNMYVDFYIPKLNLVIEYNGEQHFMFVSKFHKTNSDFKKQLERDKLKYNLIQKNGINLYKITYKDKINEKFIKNIIDNFEGELNEEI